MAIYSTLFLAQPDSLAAGFPGWKLPLAEPVETVRKNPFTGETVTIRSTAPEWDDVSLDELVMPEYDVVAVEGDYQSYLEQRIPPFVRSQAHYCTKSLTCVELEPIVAAVLQSNSAKLETALYAPPIAACGPEKLPTEFVDTIATANDGEIRDLAVQWSELMSRASYTHTVAGDRVHDDWHVETAIALLQPLCELAKQKTAGMEMYLLSEG